MSKTPATKTQTVTCLGSSTTASRGTFKWIEELKKRPQNANIRFVNLGVGGDLSSNTLERLSHVVASHPDKVIILIGINDILAQVFPNVRRFFTGWKKAPSDPSSDQFRQNLENTVRQLQQKTSAKIGLCSLQPIGEDPEPTDAVQRELNRLVELYSRIIKSITETERVSYIPFYEHLHAQIVASPGQAFTRFSFLAFYRDYVWREFILRRSFDEIARQNGWRFHIDGVHLNTAGGLILTDLVQHFLDEA